MNSRTPERFRKALFALPVEIQEKAHEAYATSVGTRQMLEQSSRSQGRLIYHFAPEAFGTLRRLLEDEYGGVVESRLVDPLGDFATLEVRVNGALLTLDFDHWDPFTLLIAGPQGGGVLQSLRPALDAGEYPVLEESEF